MAIAMIIFRCDDQISRSLIHNGFTRGHKCKTSHATVFIILIAMIFYIKFGNLVDEYTVTVFNCIGY